MKMKKWIILSVILLAAAAAVFWFAFVKGDGQGRSQARGHVHGAGPVATASPAVHEQEAPTVEIPEDRQRLIGVKTTSATVISMKKAIRLTGRIEYDEQMLYTVNTKVEGWIERLYVDYAGRFLKKGEPLAEIYSPDLLAAQQELISLKAWKKPEGKGSTDTMLTVDSARLVDAARKRLRLWDITQAQIERIEQTGKPMRTLTIISPVSGYVVKRYTTKGMRVMAGEPLLDIADLTRVWVIAEVSEPDMGRVRPGLEARITFDGMPGKVFTSRVDFIYPSMSPDTRTLKVRCTLPNVKGILKPQMFATVEITADLGSRLAVPEDALIDTGERQIVYVDRGEGLFEPRVVVAGQRAGTMREIISGLKAGEKVASSALFLIDSEAQLKGVAPVSKE
jgi:Cu(I)/Ag(I) efflux system membrane fusion protein